MIRDDEPEILVPVTFAELWKPHRHKAVHGGRGGAKSHTFAGALIDMGVERPLRVGCYREIQKSIKTSVKQLLDDKIRAHGLSNAYDSTEYSIKGPNGTEFMFAGLRTNPESVKSTEGLDIAWIEEANTVSQNSLGLLTPTVRKDTSEIWYSWNRRYADDPVDNMFLGGPPPPRSWVQQANWRDNPWFPSVLKEEMLWDKQRDMDKYLHVWEGELLKRSEARVFSNWRVEDIDNLVPSDCPPRLGADWGFAIDPTVLIECYVLEDKRILYFRREAYKVKCEIDETPALFAGTDTRDPKDARWTNRYGHKGFQSIRDGARIVADSARPETISYMKKRGFNIIRAIKGPNSVEEGVEFLKTYDIVIHPDCVHVEDEFTHYSYKIDKLTEAVLPELADRDNHVIDAARYALEDIRRGGKRGKIAMVPPEIIHSTL